MSRALAVLAAVALALAGCDWPRDQVPDGPGPTPLTGAVRPGATCDPSGYAGTAADGSPMVCSLDGKWRMAQ